MGGICLTVLHNILQCRKQNLPNFINYWSTISYLTFDMLRSLQLWLFILQKTTISILLAFISMFFAVFLACFSPFWPSRRHFLPIYHKTKCLGNQILHMSTALYVSTQCYHFWSKQGSECIKISVLGVFWVGMPYGIAHHSIM